MSPYHVGINVIISLLYFGNHFAHGILYGNILTYVIQRDGNGGVQFPEVAKDYGFKTWDVVALFLFYLPPIFLPGVYYCLYRFEQI